MSTKVYLEKIDSAFLTNFTIHNDSLYDGDVYATFTVEQRGNQTITDPGTYADRNVLFAFKLPDEYIGYHSGANFYLKLGENLRYSHHAKIFPCFEDPRHYLDAGCDHINKKISWGDLYGTYCFSSFYTYGNTEYAVPTYIPFITGNHQTDIWGNLLDPCGAKYFIILIPHTTGGVEEHYNVSFAIEIDSVKCAYTEAVYPNNVPIKNNISHIFSWNIKGSNYNPQSRNNIFKTMENLYSREMKYTFSAVFNYCDEYESAQSCPTYLKSHTLYYRKKGTSQYTQISETNDHNYVEIPADTFDIDTYEYYVAQTLENGYTVNTPLTEFYAIGQDAAPTISGVTNNSIPTVSWTDSNQAAFEIRIKDSEQNIVYTSGLIVGDNQSYQITKMLPNGTYIVEVRELNIYGIYSDWGSAQFVLNPSSVSAPTDIFVSVNNKFGVEISGTPVGSAQKTYVVRRVAGTDDIEIVGIYTGGIFTDYTAKGNTYYEYSLRNYNVAYADGAFIPVEVKVKEAIIQDGRDVTNFLDLSWSEDVTFNIEYTDEADRTLYNCLGRRYPVKEMGEWVNSVRSFVAYVRAEDINRLNDMNLNAPKVYFKGNHEYYACDMSIEDQGAYVGGGRMIRFTLTRIADDEGIII